MFIRKSTGGGYDRWGSQRSGRGLYLALFSSNRFKAEGETRAACAECRAIWEPYDRIMTRLREGICPTAEEHKVLTYGRRTGCPAHEGIGPVELRYPAEGPGKGYPRLWAAVRSCSLHQCGNFMMGAIHIGGKRIGVSGSIGHDGLPLDLEDVPREWRSRLLEVPPEVAAVYWADDGHNSIGKAAPDLRSWALGQDWDGEARRGRKLQRA